MFEFSVDYKNDDWMLFRYLVIFLFIFINISIIKELFSNESHLSKF